MIKIIPKFIQTLILSAVMIRTVFHRTCICHICTTFLVMYRKCRLKITKKMCSIFVVILVSYFVIIMLCLFFCCDINGDFHRQYLLFCHHKLLYLCLRKKLCEWKKIIVTKAKFFPHDHDLYIFVTCIATII